MKWREYSIYEIVEICCELEKYNENDVILFPSNYDRQKAEEMASLLNLFIDDFHRDSSDFSYFDMTVISLALCVTTNFYEELKLND